MRLESFGADGFIPMRFLGGDYYDFDEKSQTLIGRSTGKKYQVGDKLDAILKEVSPLTGGLLFKPK